MSFGVAEARLRRLEARIGPVEYEVLRLKERFGKVKQDLAIVPGGFGSCTTVLEGSLTYGCKAPFVALSGTITMQFTGFTTGIDYGTFTVSSSYSVSISGIDPSDASLLALVTWTPTTPRIRSTLTDTGYTFGRCSLNTGHAINLGAASGYGCAVAFCVLPVADTLSTTDSRFGGGSATRSGNHWQGSVTISGTDAAIYDFDGSTTTAGAMFTAARYHLGVQLPGSPLWTLTSTTCPTVGGVKFSITFTCATGGSGYSVGDTITLFEP